MIEAVLLERVKRSDAALRAVVGGRVHPDFVPEGWELPAVFYRRLPDRTSYNIDGSVDHRWAAFVFSCVASQFEKLQALLAAEAITRDLLGYTAMTDTEIVHRVFVENAGDQYDGEARRHLVTVKVEALCTARA